MGLVKRTYVDGETVITAENLNAIQDAIIENEEAIEDQGEAIEGKYAKPSGGIPASDMASGVQTSLGKADTALQSSDIDNTLTVTGKAADAKKTGDEISDVKNTLSHKADAIYDTTSGDIASFPDGADGLPVKDLTVAIEPVQDLHGYENPWPGGSGKNKLDWDNIVWTNGKAIKQDGTEGNFDNYRHSDYQPIEGDTAYAFSIYYSAEYDASNSIAFYDSSKNFISNSRVVVISGATITAAGRYHGTFTSPVGAAFFILNTANNASIQSNAMLELGSTVTDYEPYANICPISGWTGANISQYGNVGNFYDATGTVPQNSSDATVTVVDKHTLTITTTSSIRYGASKQLLSSYNLVAGKTYRVYAKVKSTSSQNAQPLMSVRNSNNGNVRSYSFYATGTTEGSFMFTYDPSVHNYISFFATTTNYSATSVTYTDIEFEEVRIYPITFHDAQGDPLTVYGGTLDVTSGVLTVTDANIASYNGETLPGEWISDRDVYAAGTTPTTGAQVVYKLATPQTYQLDPVTVTTLLGQNNIWSDTGAVLNCEYPADTKLYVSNKMEEIENLRKTIAPIEDGDTASKLYGQGRYFFRNGNFCKAKTDILQNAQFTLNTNYEVTTVANELYDAINPFSV